MYQPYNHKICRYLQYLSQWNNYLLVYEVTKLIKKMLKYRMLISISNISYCQYVYSFSIAEKWESVFQKINMWKAWRAPGPGGVTPALPTWPPSPAPARRSLLLILPSCCIIGFTAQTYTNINSISTYVYAVHIVLTYLLYNHCKHPLLILSLILHISNNVIAQRHSKLKYLPAYFSSGFK